MVNDLLKFTFTLRVVHHNKITFLVFSKFFVVPSKYNVVSSTNDNPTTCYLSQPYFGQVWGWSPTLGKSEDLESSGTPECSELNSKAQNTSHWGVLGVIGKVSKRRCRKWPRIGHLDVCSPSYGQKKGRESNWQFDSRPLKVGNRPLPELRMESAIRRWKDLDAGYNFGSDAAVGSYELPKSRDSARDSFGTISGLQPGSPGSLGKKW
jgi:hypothetical protein